MKNVKIHTCGHLMLAALLIGACATTMASDPAQLKTDLVTQIDQATNADDAFKATVKENLLALCTNEVFVAAVKKQNEQARTLDAIKKIDADWSAAEDELPIQSEMMSNTVATEIRRLAGTMKFMTEVFVMDNQGANVGQNVLTSDFWQGDEPKFINSFNGGKGGVDVDKPKLDKSSNRVDQKVSLPIIDAEGNVIGAICIGMSL